MPTYLELLQTEYERMGHQIEFLAPDPTWTKFHLVHAGKSIDKKILEDSVTQRVLSLYQSKFPDIPQVILDLEIRRYSLMLAAERFGLEHYDLIHTQDAFSSIAMAQLLTNQRKIPLVTTLHGCIGAEFLKYHITGSATDLYVWAYGYALDHFGAMLSDATIAPAHWIKKELNRSFDVRKKRITVVQHGLDLESFMQKLHTESNTHLREDDNPVIFNHQRLDPFKGHKFLLNALALVKQQLRPFKAYIAGYGGLRDELESFTEKLNLQSRVTFLGKRHDVPALLAQSDIVVLPSIAEGVGFSAIEAQMAGKPVVAFQTTGHSEIVDHGNTGLLSPVGDFKSMAENIEILLQDVSLREGMGARAQERAIRIWDHKRMAAETLEVYQHAIAGTGDPVPDNLIATAILEPKLDKKLGDLYRLFNTNVDILPITEFESDEEGDPSPRIRE